MAELVNSVNEKASGFDITRDAINNEIRRIRKRRQDEEKKNKAQVSPPVRPSETATSSPNPVPTLCLQADQPLVQIVASGRK